MAKITKLARPLGAATAPDIGPLAGLLSVRLSRIDGMLSRSFAATTTGRNLRSGMISSLALIVANPGISQNEIARWTGIDKAAIVAIINRFEELGWAVRGQSATDKRRHTLNATARGEAELDQIVAEMRRIEDELLENVSPADLAQLVVLLERVRESCLATIQP